MKLTVLILLLFGLIALPAVAQNVTVAYQQSVNLPVPGATAAYSLNSYCADATANEGLVTITANHPGSTVVMVITGVGVQSFPVLVPQPAPVYPAGFSPQNSDRNSREDGSYEMRFSNQPSQVLNALDLSRQQGNQTTRFHLQNADFFSSQGDSGSAVGFPSMSYSITSPKRDVVILDQSVANSRLTLQDVTLRGFHLREGNWFFHGGYTSQATFQSLLLPTDREAISGLSYRFWLGKDATLTPNVYYFGGSTGGSAGHPGAMGSLAFRHDDHERLSISGEVGVGGGVGLSAETHYLRTEDERLDANFRYESRAFHSASISNLSGLVSDLHWNRKFGGTTSVLTFSGNRYFLQDQQTQENISSAWSLNHPFGRHWSGNGGLDYSRFSGVGSSVGTLQTTQLPIGANFLSTHLGAGFQYLAPLGQVQEGSGKGVRANVTSSWHHFQSSAFVDRQTQVPTIAALLASVPGLQDLLDRLGISATSPQQVADLLRNEAILAALGYVSTPELNISPVLLQIGASLNWNPGGSSRQQLNLNFLHSNNELLSGDVRTSVYSVTYSRTLSRKNVLFVSSSLYSNKTGQQPVKYQPLFEASFRHKLDSVPWFLMPGRTGAISGTVFEDTLGQGIFKVGMNRFGGIEVILDGSRRTITDTVGHYRFTRVPYGPHRVELNFQSSRPFYFTTASPITAEINSSADFGIAYMQARLVISVRNDAGYGVNGVALRISGTAGNYSAVTDADGHAILRNMPSGNYKAEVDGDTLPIGYLPEGIEDVPVTLQTGAPSQLAFTLKAVRTIGGKVTVFDRKASKEVSVAGANVRLVELHRECPSDEEGNYLFRDLPAGTYTLQVLYEGKVFTRSVTLGPEPNTSLNNQLSVGIH